CARRGGFGNYGDDLYYFDYW
nr:immunoglobulin heavy chain junction region [Mus musculus]